jgi:hypothetical protein
MCVVCKTLHEVVMGGGGWILQTSTWTSYSYVYSQIKKANKTKEERGSSNRHSFSTRNLNQGTLNTQRFSGFWIAFYDIYFL